MRCLASSRRRNPWRLPGLVPALIALALVSSACGSHDTQGSTAVSKVTELTSVSELRDRFDQDAGKVRARITRA